MITYSVIHSLNMLTGYWSDGSCQLSLTLTLTLNPNQAELLCLSGGLIRPVTCWTSGLSPLNTTKCTAIHCLLIYKKKQNMICQFKCWISISLAKTSNLQNEWCSRLIWQNGWTNWCLLACKVLCGCFQSAEGRAPLNASMDKCSAYEARVLLGNY